MQAFTILLERGVAGQLMQLERSQDYANKSMIQLKMYKSCRVSRSVLEQARVNYDIYLPLVTSRRKEMN